MYVIGSQRMTVVDDKARPEGDWHAVDVEGVSICTSARLRYVFPALHWPEALDDAPVCEACMDAFTSPRTAETVPAQQTFEVTRALGADPAPAEVAQEVAQEAVPETAAVAVAERGFDDDLDDDTVDAEFAAVAAKLASALEPARPAYPLEPSGLPAGDDDEVDPWGSLF
jgi:hypothetical protein